MAASHSPPTRKGAAIVANAIASLERLHRGVVATSAAMNCFSCGRYGMLVESDSVRCEAGGCPFSEIAAAWRAAAWQADGGKGSATYAAEDLLMRIELAALPDGDADSDGADGVHADAFLVDPPPRAPLPVDVLDVSAAFLSGQFTHADLSEFWSTMLAHAEYESSQGAERAMRVGFACPLCNKAQNALGLTGMFIACGCAPSAVLDGLRGISGQFGDAAIADGMARLISRLRPVDPPAAPAGAS